MTDFVSLSSLNLFEQAYLECALWADLPEDSTACAIELSDDVIKRMATDCRDFQAKHADLLEQMSNARQAGHDFWLTRQGHGAGFWDRGLGELGDKLTEAARAYGSCDLTEDSDGNVYLD